MNRILLSLPLLVAFTALTVGCAAPAVEPEEAEHAAASELTQTLSDSAIEGKLAGILKGVDFMSESDFPYVVFEGEKVGESRLTEALVRKHLRKAVKENNSSERDISSSSCRASALDIGQTIADGDAAVVPADQDADDYSYMLHDRQLGIALKVMRSQLASVVGFTFGTHASGDMDDVGTVLYVYVGISKTSGKLIAIMTEAVYT